MIRALRLNPRPSTGVQWRDSKSRRHSHASLSPVPWAEVTVVAEQDGHNGVYGALAVKLTSGSEKDFYWLEHTLKPALENLPLEADPWGAGFSAVTPGGVLSIYPMLPAGPAVTFEAVKARCVELAAKVSATLRALRPPSP